MVTSEPEGTELPEIAEFDVWREHGMYLAKHKSNGRTIQADSVRRLELLASAVRIGASLEKVWTGRPVS